VSSCSKPDERLSISNSLFLSSSIRSESFQKVGVELTGSEVRICDNPPMDRDGGGHPVDDKHVESPGHATDRLVAVLTVGDDLRD